MTTTPRLWNSLTQVNTTDGGKNQFESRITPLQDGGYIVVWTDLSHAYNPLGEAVVGQRYDAAGNKVGGEVKLSQFTNGDQFSPAITTLANGDVAVAFVDLFTGNNNIYVRVFDPSLNFVREDDIDLGSNQTFHPALTALAGGSYAVSYTLTVGTNTFIEGRIVSATGDVGGQFDIDRRIDVRNDQQDFSHPEMLSNGNFVVLDQGLFNNVPGSTFIRFGIFTAAGMPVLTNEPVLGGAITAPEQSDVAALHGGGFVLTWAVADSGGSNIRASIIGNDGFTIIASDILVNTTTAGTQKDPHVVALDDGGFLATWQDFAVSPDERGQRFDAHGDKIGAEFTLQNGGVPDHRDAALLADGRVAFAFDASSTDSDVTTSIFTDDTPLDFNANGLSDILWQNDNGAPALWQMNGLTVQSNSPAGPFNPGPSWHVKDSGDFNGDGHADILWQNDDGMPAIWLMNGSNALSNGAAGSFNPGPDWQVKAAGDFNGDGKSDILWQGSDGTPAIWLMDGLTVLSNSPAGSFNPGPSWQIKDTGDFNGDGKSDILWQNDDGAPAIWLMNGSTVLSNSAAGPFNPGPTWHIKGTGDFNGDGKSDILWQGQDGTAAIWLMDGTTATFAGAVGSNPGPTWEVKGTGDFNGDGKSDILWQGQDGTPAIWTMDGTHVLSVGVAGSFNPGADWHVII
jgi:FG-GAP-like repeat